MVLQSRQQSSEVPARKNLLEYQELELAERLAAHQAIECTNEGGELPPSNPLFGN
jgi:hypothetical protein